MEEKIDYSFNGQRKGEDVKLIVKNHPFILFWPGLKAIFFFALGISSFFYLGGHATFGLILVLCILIGFALGARSFYDYSQSVFIITNQRIIYVDQNGFFKRKIVETELSKIQDVASSTAGFFKMLLKFGDLVIRTAGASKGEEIVVKDIPNPYEVQKRVHV